MARSLRFLTWLHPRFKTPVIAIAIGVAIPCLHARYLNGNIDRIVPLILAAVCAWGVAYLLVTLSVVLLRIRRPDLPRAYRSPWFPAADYLQRRDYYRHHQYHPAGDGQPRSAGAIRHHARPDRRLCPFWTVCVQRVNPFRPVPVEEVVERAIGNYEKQNQGEMTPDALRPSFSTPLMNAVQRDLAGWDSEKLSERGAAPERHHRCHLQRSPETAVYGQHSQLRICRRGPVTRPAQGRIRAHQSGWLKRQPVTFGRQNRPPTSLITSTVFRVYSKH